jgi:hypothetical protein
MGAGAGATATTNGYGCNGASYSIG